MATTIQCVIGTSIKVFILDIRRFLHGNQAGWMLVGHKETIFVSMVVSEVLLERQDDAEVVSRI
jgi:hypothetical protein